LGLVALVFPGLGDHRRQGSGTCDRQGGRGRQGQPPLAGPSPGSRSRTGFLPRTGSFTRANASIVAFDTKRGLPYLVRYPGRLIRNRFNKHRIPQFGSILTSATQGAGAFSSHIQNLVITETIFAGVHKLEQSLAPLQGQETVTRPQGHTRTGRYVFRAL